MGDKTGFDKLNSTKRQQLINAIALLTQVGHLDKFKAYDFVRMVRMSDGSLRRSNDGEIYVRFWDIRGGNPNGPNTAYVHHKELMAALSPPVIQGHKAL